MAIYCPHCSTKVPEIRRRINLPRDISYEVETPTYYVLHCIECRNEAVVEKGDSLFTEDQVRWPLPDTEVPAEIPDFLARPFRDAKLAHAVGAEIAALMAARTAIVLMQRDQKCGSLKGLVEQGKLSLLLYQQADEVREWANVAGHEIIPVDSVDAEDVEQLLAYLSVVLDALYVEPAKLAAMRQKRKGDKDQTRSEPDGRATNGTAKRQDVRA